jgi:hypothetical protein
MMIIYTCNGAQNVLSECEFLEKISESATADLYVME